MNLASYLLLDAFRGDCETAIVVSNDADLKAPIEIVKDELGIPVGVLNPHPPKRQSRDLQPTFFKQLRHGPIAASQFPPILTDARQDSQAAWVVAGGPKIAEARFSGPRTQPPRRLGGWIKSTTTAAPLGPRNPTSAALSPPHRHKYILPSR